VLHAEFLGYSPPSPLKRSLTRVNFSLHAGEVLGVAGLTGSGRTELLETIFGLYPRWQITGGLLLAESGRYKPLRSPGSALKNGIAYVPADRETRCLVPTRSVSENITLSSLTSLGTAGFLWARREQSVVHDAMQRLRIRITDPHARVGQLSAGDQQKIALARCLLTRPQILLLDEPTQGIDISAKAEIYNLIAQLAARGTAILMASSDLPELLAMCDRILVLQDGTLTASLHGPSTSQSEIMTAASRGN
jgi:ribose transport system ATP-binding protein